MLPLKRDMWPEAVKWRVVCRRRLRGPRVGVCLAHAEYQGSQNGWEGKVKGSKEEDSDEDPSRTWKLWKGFG